MDNLADQKLLRLEEVAIFVVNHIGPAQVPRNDACPSVRSSVRPSHFFPDNRSKDFSHFVYGYWAL